MHWHPNADEWQYFISGQGQLTVFNTGPNAVTQNFNPGDIGYVKRAYGHYIRNTGNSDLVYLEVFRSSYFSDVSLSDWLAHSPRALVASVATAISGKNDLKSFILQLPFAMIMSLSMTESPLG